MPNACTSLDWSAVPSIGVSTRDLRGDDCRVRIIHAIESGIRFIDTAQSYENENAIGEAIQVSGTPRHELFISTKVSSDDYNPYDLLWSVRESLDRLRLNKVDLLMLEAPSTGGSIKATLKALAETIDHGICRYVGVANFSASQFDEAVANCVAPLVCNEVEYHPFIDQSPILDAARRHGARVLAYAPLAMGAVNMSDVMLDIAATLRRTPEQVAMRWLLQQKDVIVLPRSGGEGHLQSIMDVQSFSLSPKQMARISALSTENLQFYQATS